MKSSKLEITHHRNKGSFFHLPLGDTARAGLSAALTSALELQLAGAGSTVESMVQFFTQRTAGQVAVDFTFSLAVATHNNTTRDMGQVYAIVGLVHFLTALAAAAHKLLLKVIFVHTEALHHLLKFLHFFWRYRHALYRTVW